MAQEGSDPGGGRSYSPSFVSSLDGSNASVTRRVGSVSTFGSGSGFGAAPGAGAAGTCVLDAVSAGAGALFPVGGALPSGITGLLPHASSGRIQ